MKEYIKNIIYSFPAQLLILQLKSYHFLLLVWVAFTYIINGGFVDYLGLQYLFLDPEYLGCVSPFSFFLVGIAFGIFVIVWNLTLYILTSYHFPFLATLSRPFQKYCINNSVLPLTFLLYFFVWVIRFQQSSGLIPFWDAVLLALPLLGGCFLFIGLSVIYFVFANNDLKKYTTIQSTAPHTFSTFNQRRKIEHRYFNYKKYSQPKVRYYLNEKFVSRYVRSVDHYSSGALVKVFRQNHRNAIVFFIAILALMLLLGVLIDLPVFRVPAGATIFLLGSLIISAVGAFSFSFRTWATSGFILIFFCINHFYRLDDMRKDHAAFGLDYSERSTYDIPAIKEKVSKQIAHDVSAEIDKLNKWKSSMPTEKPKLVIVSASGGGLKSSAWTYQSLNHLDSLSGGRFSESLVLITGSSGGMIGAAYFREQLLEQYENPSFLPSPSYRDAISEDLQNPTAYAMVVNDIFMPWLQYGYNGFKYRKDRGYIFEEVLNENTGRVFEKNFNAYTELEAEAHIPGMVISPVILKDSRKLILSSSPASYLSFPKGGEMDDSVMMDAVPLTCLAANPLDLKLSSALRMSATYPYILPPVQLPTKRALTVSDAGYRDNLGISNAYRYISYFQDWIKENTSGVVLVQVRVTDKFEEPRDRRTSLVHEVTRPIIAAVTSERTQEYELDNQYYYLKSILGEDYLQLVNLTYKPTKLNRKISMSFHLTARERRDIYQALKSKNNQEQFTRVLGYLRTD